MVRHLATTRQPHYISSSSQLSASGRAITSANIFVFVFAFLVQYLFGMIIHLWPGGHTVISYQVAFSALVLAELLCLIWYAIAPLLQNRHSK